MSPHGWRPVHIAIFVFFLGIVVYGSFEARGLIQGPSIDLSDTYTDSQIIDIHGVAHHTVNLLMNGYSVPLTEEGVFTQHYVPMHGYNRIILDAKDRYGKTVTREIAFMYIPTSTPIQIATSTASTSTQEEYLAPRTQ